MPFQNVKVEPFTVTSSSSGNTCWNVSNHIRAGRVMRELFVPSPSCNRRVRVTNARTAVYTCHENPFHIFYFLQIPGISDEG
jgi:hypothetical protein